MQANFLTHPAYAVAWIGLAFAVNVGLQLLCGVLFARAGAPIAMTVALISGNRSVGFAWAASGQDLAPATERFFAMSVIPIFVLPLLTSWLTHRIGALTTSREGGPQPF